MKRWIYVSSAIIVAAVIALLFEYHHVRHGDYSVANTSIPLVDQTTLQALPHKSASSANVSHLANNLLPPTNSWLSGMVLQQTPDAVYPMPLSFLAKDTGFEIGLPTVTSTSTEIAGEHVPGITANLSATTFKLVRYDKISATLEYFNGPQAVGKLTVTEGSPFVFYTAITDNSLTLSGINPANIAEQNTHYIRYTSNGHTYAIYGPQSTVTVSPNSTDIVVQPGATIALYALPGTSDTLQQYAGNTIESVQVERKQNSSNVATTLAYKTSNGKPTVFAAMPYETTSGQSIATYQSIFGQMNVYVGNQFTSTVPTVAASNTLDLSHLTSSQKNQLIAMLPADVAATNINEQDSYYAGKQLARAANLLSIAEQLHQSDSANKLKTILDQAFAKRLTSSYFYYDTTLHGVAATDQSFGSQDFNDHHFHYGYWLYAGSIMAKYDSSFVSKYKNQINLLAADIADYQQSSEFPEERTYDPYAEHSWAAGLAPFSDGNNQESSSEAINAWNGVTLWGQVTHNVSLQQAGEWMLSNESHTAAATWRTVDTSDPSLRNYTSPVVGITFGGKRVYATWFSADPSATLGIQLIPMNPGMVDFSQDQHISQVVAATIQNNNYNVSLGDYILMYLSLANPQKAASLAPQQTNIDNGDSKTYMNAFIFAQLDK